MTADAKISATRLDKTTSFFEFWPAWIMYFPVGLQWIILGIRYRSITLPFSANPNLRLSGMVGVGKSELFTQATGKCAEVIMDWMVFASDKDNAESQAITVIEDAATQGIPLPFVCKPDIGCRGAGVKLIKDKAHLVSVINSYPSGTALMVQKLATSSDEVGIFYVKHPHQDMGDIASITIKTRPHVVGDGTSTLGDLIQKNPRANELLHQYKARHASAWDSVPAAGERVGLVFSASHSKGCIFTDGRHLITPELTAAIEDIMQGLPDFHYGRLDVKYPDINALKQGQNLEVVEVNGASAEAAHIWDKDTKFLDAIKTLMWQYRTLFQIGAYHRSNGRKAPSLKAFIAGVMREKGLTKYYPYTD